MISLHFSHMCPVTLQIELLNGELCHGKATRVDGEMVSGGTYVVKVNGTMAEVT